MLTDNNLSEFGLSQCCARIQLNHDSGFTETIKSVHVVEKGNEDYGMIMASAKIVTQLMNKYHGHHFYPTKSVTN